MAGLNPYQLGLFTLSIYSQRLSIFGDRNIPNVRVQTQLHHLRDCQGGGSVHLLFLEIPCFKKIRVRVQRGEAATLGSCDSGLVLTR